MRCPVCRHTESRVIDSRPTPDGTSIRRRRECVSCGRRFTTYETIEYAPLMVIKKDGSREAFSHDKLLRGVLKSCEKRPVTLAQLEAMVSEIEVELQIRMDREVPSAVIGELVMDKLKKIDQVAYVRCASVYREFKDIQSFLEELKVILEHEKN